MNGRSGFAQTREMLAGNLVGKPLDILTHVSKAPIIPGPRMPSTFRAYFVRRPCPWRSSMTSTAIANDCILEAIAGVLKSDATGVEPYATESDNPEAGAVIGEATKEAPRHPGEGN